MINISFVHRILIILLISYAQLCCKDDLENRIRTYFFSPDISSLNISDWKNPTVEDYLFIQRFLKQKVLALVNTPMNEKPFHNDYLNKEFYGWVTYRMNRFAFAKDKTVKPFFRIEYFNNDPNNKEKCVICYASFPSGDPIRDYPRALTTILASLKKFNFDGHFIYQIGGWPNVKKNRLKYADVPFAFKPFLFEEVRDLGYENILWLDACCVPVKSLDLIFNHIKEKGLCFHSYGSLLNWREFCNGYKYLVPFLHLSENKKYEEISSQIVGINVKNQKANNLLDEWIKAAKRKIPFLLSDELPFMYLVNHLKLLYGRIPSIYYVETPCNTGNFAYWEKKPKAIIYHQYDFLTPEFMTPEDLFDH